ncbi:MAG: hypothetical protein HXS48_20350 [Theionarchaea archaeon]|nr:hypothetical protein [Theionarchaea archaeon]
MQKFILYSSEPSHISLLLPHYNPLHSQAQNNLKQKGSTVNVRDISDTEAPITMIPETVTTTCRNAIGWLTRAGRSFL